MLWKARTPGNSLSAPAFSSDSSVVLVQELSGEELGVAATGRIVFRRALDGKILRPPIPAQDVLSMPIVLSPEGDRIATGIWNKMVTVYDLRSGKAISLKGHLSAIKALAFSASGQELASASDAGEIKIWNLQTGMEKFSLHGHRNEVTGLCYSRDGQTIYSSGNDGTVRAWSSQPKSRIRGLFNPDLSVIGHARNGGFVAATSSNLISGTSAL